MRHSTIALLTGVFLAGCGGGREADDPAIRELVSRGAKIEVDERASGEPVVEVRLIGRKFTDADLAVVGKLESLRTLYLTASGISDDGLAHLEGATALRGLWLYRSAIGDGGVDHLKDLGALETLDLRGTNVSDDGLAKLKSSKSLRKVLVFGTNVTPAGVELLRAALPECDVDVSPPQ